MEWIVLLENEEKQKLKIGRMNERKKDQANLYYMLDRIERTTQKAKY